MVRTIKVLPSSQLPATSWVANDSGKNTDLIPWVSHFSGNNAANCCIQIGSWLKTKKTPLKNCKIITIGETIAEAPRPLLGTTEKAIPKTVEHALPKMIIQVKVIHFADVVGISKPKNAAPNPKSSAVCKIIKIVTKYALPIKYAETEIGRPRKRFKVPNSRSIGIVIASC